MVDVRRCLIFGLLASLAGCSVDATIKGRIGQDSIAKTLTTLKLLDATTGSAQRTQFQNVKVVIDQDEKAIGWCLSETQTTAPVSGSPCLGGQGPLGGWHPSRPTSLNLSSGESHKQVHLWTLSDKSEVNQQLIQAGIDYDTSAPVVTYSVSPSSPSNGSTVLISGTCSDLVSGIKDNGILACVNSSGNCSYPSDFTLNTSCSGGAYTLIAPVIEGIYELAVVGIDKMEFASNVVGSGGQNYLVDTTNPSLASFINPSSNITTGGTTYLFSWSATDSGGSELAATNAYGVELYSTADCSGTAMTTSTETNPLYPASGLSSGTIYTLRVRTSDGAGNISAWVCSPSVAIDASAPSLSLSDQSSTSSLASDSILVDVTIAEPGGTAKWCLSETQTTPPASGAVACSGGTGWVGGAPASFTLTSGDGQKEVYLWIADGGDVVTTATVKATIWLDTIPPVPTLLASPATPTNSTSASFTFSATDTGGSGIATQECELDGGGWSVCTSPKLFSSLTAAAHSFQFRTTDNAGNTALSAVSNWLVDLTGPALTVTDPALVSNLNSVSFSGACETGREVVVTGTESATLSCPAGIWSHTTSSQTTDGIFNYVFTQTDQAGNSTVVNAMWTRDTLPPQLVSSEMIINSGAITSINRIVQVALKGDGTGSNINEFCLRWNSTTAPLASDTCWIPVNNPSPGLVPDPVLVLSNFPFQLGFGPGVYTVYSWVKDAAGNISVLSNSGLGTSARDKDSITYDPGIPPTITDVWTTNTTAPTNPPTNPEMTIPVANTVFIKWQASDDEALPAQPMSLYYTTDDSTYTLIANNLFNGSNAGCVVDNGATTLDDNSTGCYTWTNGAPASTFFRIRVATQDSDGLVASREGFPINASEVRFLAGNTSLGTSGNAKSAMFVGQVSSSTGYINHQHFVVTEGGVIFFRDLYRGILKVDPATGRQDVYIPLGASVIGDGVNVSAATVRSPLILDIDHQGRLIIQDYNVIRRVDLTTNIITTIIGGGSDTADTVNNPKLAQITSVTVGGGSAGSAVSLFTVPNGDIYFRSENFAPATTTAASSRFRRFDNSNNRLLTVRMSGTGDSTDAAQDISLCTSRGMAASFDLQSGIKAFYASVGFASGTCLHDNNTYYDAFARLNATTYVSEGPQPPKISGDYSNSALYSGKNGKLYRFKKAIVYLYNETNQTWTTLIGTGTLGNCADNTLATSCNVSMEGMFVTQQGHLYVYDNGRMRTLDENGNIQTIMGQSFSSGDGARALFSRFKDIQSLKYWNDGGTEKVVVHDTGEYRLREFVIGGNVNTVAGNGSNANPNTANPAATEPIRSVSSSSISNFQINPTTGDIYYFTSNTEVGRLNRATGLWQTVMGNTGGFDYITGDGQVGALIQVSPPSTMLIGLAGNDLLTYSHRWNSGATRDPMFKLYDMTDSYRQRHLSGIIALDSPMCANTTATASCEHNTEFYSRADWVYDSYTSSWLAYNNSSIRSLPESGSVGTLQNIPRSISGFDYHRDAGATVNRVFYCAVGNLYKFDVGGAETQLIFSTPNMKCTGRNMKYVESRDTLIFSYQDRGLSGVAEYLNP